MLTETVTVERPPAKGKFGDPAGAPGPTFPLEALFAPNSSIEVTDRANAVDTDVTLYVENNTATGVLPSDRIRARGELYEVVGKPAVWAGFGTVIHLRRFSG